MGCGSFRRSRVDSNQHSMYILSDMAPCPTQCPIIWLFVFGGCRRWCGHGCFISHTEVKFILFRSSEMVFWWAISLLLSLLQVPLLSHSFIPFKLMSKDIHLFMHMTNYLIISYICSWRLTNALIPSEVV